MSYRVAIGPSSFGEVDRAPLRMLEEAHCEIVPNPYGRRLTEDEIIAHIADADGLIAGLEPLNRRVLESAKRLRAIARVGVGLSNVDGNAAKELKIAVSITPEGPANAVAEMTIAALLSLLRRLHTMDMALHRREWTKEIGLGLRGTKVLLIGYGRIGQRVGKLLHAFGAHVLVWDPYIKDHVLPEEAELIDTLHHGLTVADVVSVHASGETPILDASAIREMKRGSVLLNSARGELVDETALADALISGALSGAWVDAFSQEPYRGPLCDCPTALLTPHAATYTKQCRHDMETAAVRNLLHDLDEAQ